MVYKNKREMLAALVKKTDSVMDLGFWGQGVPASDPNWPHAVLKEYSDDVSGLDIEFDEARFPDRTRYIKASAEQFDTGRTYDVIFAGDLIEHISNLGLFLDSCKRHLKPGGKLVVTTPNTFNLYNLASKITRYEPPCNSDHTVYFNTTTLRQLLGKNGWEVSAFDYMYALGVKFTPSIKHRIVSFFYKIAAHFTDKYLEEIVMVARPKTNA